MKRARNTKGCMTWTISWSLRLITSRIQDTHNGERIESDDAELSCWPYMNPFMRWSLLQRQGCPYRSRPRFALFRSCRPIDRHFSWQHVPTLNQFPEKQSREVALRVEEYQML